MEKNIFHDFEENRDYTIELLDRIASPVTLFMVSDQLKFLYFNRAADQLFGYEQGALLSLAEKDPLCIFHPDFQDSLYSEIISCMRTGRLVNYDCRILCRDGSYRWTKLSADLVQQKDGGRLYFHGVLTLIEAPRDTILQGRHFLIAAGQKEDRRLLSDFIEALGGTFDLTDNGLDALEQYQASPLGEYDAIFIGSRLTGINGFELAKEIRFTERDDSETTALILLVFPDDRETMEHAREIGVNRFLQKPLERRDLSAVLKELSVNKK